MSAFTDQLKEESLILRETGVNRASVRDMSPENRQKVLAAAMASRDAQRTKPSSRNPLEDKERDRIFDALDKAKASGHDKQVPPVKTNDALPERQPPIFDLNTKPPVLTTDDVDISGGGGASGGRWQDFEICGGTTITVWVK